MDKLSRNIYIGNMVKKDPDLSIKLQKLLFKFKQKFIEENNIFINNIIETTKDSLVLVQKIPTTAKSWLMVLMLNLETKMVFIVVFINLDLRVFYSIL